MPLEVVWSAQATRQLGEIREYVATDKPEAKVRLATRLVAITELLGNHAHLGRAGTTAKVRELIVPGTPFILIYRVQKQRILISAVVHGARRRK